MSDPYHAEADEYGLIGACLTGGIDVCFEVFAKIPPGAIQNHKLGQVYEVMKGLVANSQRPDLQSLSKEWKKSIPQEPLPFEELNRADELCPSPANHPAFAQAVLEAIFAII